jgi:hypothetical protein
LITSVSDLASALSGTMLANRTIVDLPILDTGQSAYALAITPAEVEGAWRVAHGLLAQTGRAPLVVTCWGGKAEAKGLEDVLRNEDMFDRWPYEQCTRSSAANTSPAAILQAADNVDVAAFIDELAARRDNVRKLHRALGNQLESTGHLCGTAPTPEEVARASLDGRPLATEHDLDRWLLDWERDHGGTPDLQRDSLEWFDPGVACLLFMPTQSSWDCLAYVHWWGMFAGAERYIALGREWSRRYGGELVAHYGTMLQCLVSSPPATVEEAWELGRQHDLIAPCTLALPGIRLRHYAAALRGHDRWFLHERP